MWLLEQSAIAAMERAYRAAGASISTEQVARFEARHEEFMGAGSSRVLTIAGNNAEIEVSGILTNAPDIFAFLFGGGNTTYPEIISALAEAQATPEVDNITLAIDSPGGIIDGLFDVLQAIQSTVKPIKASVTNMGASAAYAIAAQAGEIVATNAMTLFGSIGIVATIDIPENEVIVASTKAPNKAPDVETEEGRAIVRAQLDAMHEEFAGVIATGRGVTSATVNSDFGKGATVIAGDALKRGMIDAVTPSIRGSVVAPVDDARQLETRAMNMSELQRDHGDLYAQVLAEGMNAERDRVCAHLTYGMANDAMAIASPAITAGTPMTATIQAQYNTAKGAKTAIGETLEDEIKTAAAADKTGATAQITGGDQRAEVAAKVVAAMGILPAIV